MSEEQTLESFSRDGLEEAQEETDGWTRRSIAEVSEWTSAGGTPQTSNADYWNGSIPWVQTGELTKRRISTTEKHITEAGLKESTAEKFPAGTLLIGMYGEPTVGESALLDIEATTNQACCAVFPDMDVVNGGFLHQMLQYEKPRLYSLRAGTGQKNIRQGIIRKFEIGIPPLEEQHKIASVLYTVDQIIRTTEEIIEQTQRVKGGLIQKFYSRGYYDYEEWQEVDKQDACMMVRTEKIPLEWDIKELDEISHIKTGHTPSTSVDEYWDGEIPWIDIHDLTQLEKTEIHTTDDTITKEGLENSGAKLLPRDTLVVCRTGAIGATAILGAEMATDQDQVTFECDESVILPQYLMFLVEYATPQLERLSAGSTHDKVQLHFFSDLYIPLPGIGEQKKIVDALGSVENTILANKDQLDNLRLLKGGLMQDLLSGEVRTPGKGVEVVEDVLEHG